MRHFVLFILVLVVSATDGQDDASKKSALTEELKKLEGKWAQVSVEVDGKRSSDEDAPKVTLTITGNKWIESSVAVPDHGAFWTFKIDPAKKPKQIDLTDKLGDQGKPQTFPGIYALDGDKLSQIIDFYGIKAPAAQFLIFTLVHMVHHRGQLSGYLRPMGGKVPSIYGGSFDEQWQGPQEVNA